MSMISKNQPTGCSSRGLTIVELVIILAILGILISISAANLRPLGNDLENAVQETAAFFKYARIKAISTTSAYQVVFESNTKLKAEYALFCDTPNDMIEDIRLQLELRENITIKSEDFQPGDVLVCFNNRGTTNQTNPTVILQDQYGNEKAVEVFVGGAVVIQ